MLEALHKTWHRSSHNSWIFYKKPGDPVSILVETDTENRTISVKYPQEGICSYRVRLPDTDPCPHRAMRNAIRHVLPVVYDSFMVMQNG